jgi:hypothetical protein
MVHAIMGVRAPADGFSASGRTPGSLLHERIVADRDEQSANGGPAPNADGLAEPGPPLARLGVRRSLCH